VDLPELPLDLGDNDVLANIESYLKSIVPSIFAAAADGLNLTVLLLTEKNP
jgi:hypothetical protein